MNETLKIQQQFGHIYTITICTHDVTYPIVYTLDIIIISTLLSHDSDYYYPYAFTTLCLSILQTVILIKLIMITQELIVLLHVCIQ